MDLQVASSLANLSSLSFTPAEFFICMGVLLVLLLFLANRLKPKCFYIIRHGETLLNQAHIKQGADGKLSPAGILQARALGTALQSLRIQEICSSPFERAVETATIMSEQLTKKITVSPLLAERKSPSEVIGKSVDDPEVQRIVGLTESGFHEDTYRFSDEENFQELIKRAKACLTYLSKRPGSRIVVVTHRAFLKILLSYLLYRDGLTASDLVKLGFFNPVDNGGITVCIYHPWHPFSKTRGWEVVTYNQVAS
ncbi:MAG: histidine phosphatase family protein [Patescibacteria group bacterium]